MEGVARHRKDITRTMQQQLVVTRPGNANVPESCNTAQVLTEYVRLYLDTQTHKLLRQ